MARKISIGVLFSHSGPYRLMGEASRSGALKGIEQVNGDDRFDLSFDHVERDPAGDVDAYAPLSEEILSTSGARHLSAARHPGAERRSSLRWNG
ncbi:transporter substrate-binding protein [Paracoccus tibetensis]|uniref:Substrate-binding protein domain-containing protein n=1 Tax=Paracoccus tibetensis TaxID=336292 RepID=A0A1G5K060_9RHOB|nr:transporter substrate-binding protein [Paracoccus tibetensis]SCY93551.1 substrate-binding protein domain-containing protein [Paracoccus tibetensis]